MTRTFTTAQSSPSGLRPASSSLTRSKTALQVSSLTTSGLWACRTKTCFRDQCQELWTILIPTSSSSLELTTPSAETYLWLRRRLLEFNTKRSTPLFCTTALQPNKCEPWLPSTALYLRTRELTRRQRLSMHSTQIWCLEVLRKLIWLKDKVTQKTTWCTILSFGSAAPINGAFKEVQLHRR